MSSRPQVNTQLLEPRRQVALPDSPPLTPPQFKGSAQPFQTQSTSFSANRGEPHPSLGHIESAAQSFDRSASSPTRPPLSPEDIPRSAGHVGLGFAFSRDVEIGEKVSSAYSQPNMSLSTQVSQLGTHLAASKMGFMRVPRRIRPALLAATVLFAIMMVCASNYASAPAPAHLNSAHFRTSYLANMRRPADALPGQDDDSLAAKEAVFRRPRPPPPVSSTPALEFASNEDELLALVGFITAATGNSLPSSVDPSAKIDMSVLVGFDPTAAGAKDDLEFLKDEVNVQYPLVLFGRMRDPWHQEMIQTLEQWSIVPELLVVEVDQRDDAATLEPVLERLFGTDALPQLVLNGKSLGPAQTLLGMEPEDLRAKINASNDISVEQPAKKHKGAARREKERQHRVLRPQPIEERDIY